MIHKNLHFQYLMKGTQMTTMAWPMHALVAHHLTSAVSYLLTPSWPPLTDRSIGAYVLAL